MIAVLPAGRSARIAFVIAAVLVCTGGTSATQELELRNVSPSAVNAVEGATLTVEGSGFGPETQIALVGGGVHEVGQTGETEFLLPLGLAFAGDRILVAGLDISILDAGDPTHPEVMGRSGPLGFFARGLAVVENHAYTIDASSGTSMRVVDVSDSAGPRLGAELALPCPAARVVGTAQALYLPCTSGELLVMDRSDPAQPFVAGIFPLGQRLQGAAVQDDLLVATDLEQGLFILGLDDPLAPAVLGHEPAAPGGDVTIEGSMAYVGALTDRSIKVVDIGDPRHPRRLGSSPTQAVADDPATRSGFVFAADSKRLWIHDARHPRDPAPAYRLDIGTTLFDVEVSGTLLAVGDQGDFRVRLFDVSLAEPPGLVNQLTGLGGITPGGILNDRAYLRVPFDGARVMDLSRPERPRILGCLSGGDLREVEGDLAFLVDGPTIGIHDVSRPQHPVRVGTFTAPDLVRDVTAAGSIVYAALDDGRVLVLDVARPSAPTLLAAIPRVEEGVTGNLTASGTLLAYRVTEQGAIQIVDVSQPSMPRLAGNILLSPFLDNGNVVLQGGLLYAAEGRAGLQVVDLADPDDPVRIGGLEGINAAVVQVSGSVSFVRPFPGMGGPRQLVVDLEDPRRPRLAGGLGWTSAAVGTRGELVYLADPWAGMQVVRLNPLLAPPTVSGPSTADLLVPAGFAPGPYDVVALNPDGSSAFLRNAVEVVGETPTPVPLRPGRDRQTPCASLRD